MSEPEMTALYRRAMVCAELQRGQDRTESRLAMMMIAAAHKGGWICCTGWGWPDAREGA